MSSLARRWAVLGLLVGTVGCTGLVGGAGDGKGNGPKEGEPYFPPGVGVDPETGKPVPIDCSLDLPQAGEERPYRLTPTQYTNTVSELLGGGTINVELAQDNTEAASALAVRKWNEAAELVVPSQSSWMNAYVSCSPASGDMACDQSFLLALAERAFRRPLIDDEKTWLSSSWDGLPNSLSESEKLSVMVQAILQAPQFLYLYVEGTPIANHPHGLRRLNGYEIAQRLSYFLWDSLPDAELLAAAADGSLDTVAGVQEQATRLLTDDKAKPVLRGFLVDWLQIDGNGALLRPIELADKNADEFPEMDATLRQSMRKEIESFMDYVMFERDGSVEDLLTSTRAYVNGPLAKLYGVSGGPTTANDWKWVDLNAAQRAGILTRAGFLAIHATQTNDMHIPIRRGVFMLREMLCGTIPPPPDKVVVPEVEPNGQLLTLREQAEETTKSDTCNTCHATINPLGFPFVHYDAIGKWHDTDPRNGGAVNAKSTLTMAGEMANGDVDGAVDLSSRLVMSDRVRACMSNKWFEHALRRVPSDLDACTASKIAAEVADTGSIRDLLLSIVASDAFLNVNHGTEGQP